MTRNHGRLAIAGGAGLLLFALLASTATASIQGAQIAYQDGLFWQQGNWVEYSFTFFNRYVPGDNNTAAQGGADKWYLPTTSINATIRYNVSAHTAGVANITEIISGIRVQYNYPLNTSPFIAFYNTSVDINTFAHDFLVEVHGGAAMGPTFAAPSSFTSSAVINETGTAFTIGTIVNQYMLYKANNTAVLVDGPGVNRFIVSSNITGPVSASSHGTRDKVIRHGLFYTPMAFAGLNHTFWLDTSLFATEQFIEAGDLVDIQYMIRRQDGTIFNDGVHRGVQVGNGNASLAEIDPQLLGMSPGKEKTFTATVGGESLNFEITVIRLARGGNQFFPGAFGLWAANDTGFGMRFREDETYTYTLGQEDAFRWRSKFELRYPKVDGIEQMFLDTETGILLEYYTEQTRWDGYVGEHFYANIRPHGLRVTMTGISITMGPNATPVIPGYPVLVLLVAVGVGIIFLRRKMKVT